MLKCDQLSAMNKTTVGLYQETSRHGYSSATTVVLCECDIILHGQLYYNSTIKSM